MFSPPLKVTLVIVVAAAFTGEETGYRKRGGVQADSVLLSAAGDQYTWVCKDSPCPDEHRPPKTLTECLSYTQIQRERSVYISHCHWLINLDASVGKGTAAKTDSQL